MPNLINDLRRLEEESAIRRQLRVSLLDWSGEALTPMGLVPAAHHRLLIRELDDLTRGRFNRLMVLMPPGSAKSTYASILFPAWWLMRNPRGSIIAASHTAKLAEYFSRRLRQLIESREGQLGYHLSSAERAVSQWRISTGGEYLATGIRGAITGRRADLAIIDDPIKSQFDADNAQYREHVWEWYRSTLTTRLKPRAKIVLVMTRWHDDDLGGRLLARSAADWRVLRLPALAEEGDPLGRSIGAPLWPEWEDAAGLAAKRALLGERTWSALYQQSPRPLTGGLFKVAGLAAVDAAPRSGRDRTVRAWDLAATAATAKGDPDWTAGVKLARDSVGHFTVLDVVRLRGSPRQVEDTIVATARTDGTAVWIGLPEDPGQAGKSQVAYFAGRLAGYRVIASRETGAKVTRALPLASQIEANNVSIVRGHWNHAFLEELRDFPHGAKDDQVDALSRAFSTLIGAAEPIHAVTVPFLSR